MKNFYILALCASRVRSTSPIEIAFTSDVTFATTDEMANENGLRMARAKWPEAEGWTTHSARARLVERAGLLDALRLMAEEDPDDPKSDTSGDYTILM
jgi:hypothetical protein